MRQQWFTHVRLPVAYLAPLTAGLSVSLTTPALNRRRILWFGTPDCSATPEDLPPSLAQHGSSQRSSTSLPLPFQDTRAESIGPRLEPCFPLGFQCIGRSCL